MQSSMPFLGGESLTVGRDNLNVKSSGRSMPASSMPASSMPARVIRWAAVALAVAAVGAALGVADSPYAEFTYFPTRECSGPVVSATCPTSSQYQGDENCCDWCDDPKLERDCLTTGAGCNRSVFSGGPATCGVMVGCGQRVGTQCIGGVVTGMTCVRVFCSE